MASDFWADSLVSLQVVVFTGGAGNESGSESNESGFGGKESGHGATGHQEIGASGHLKTQCSNSSEVMSKRKNEARFRIAATALVFID